MDVEAGRIGIDPPSEVQRAELGNKTRNAAPVRSSTEGGKVGGGALGTDAVDDRDDVPPERVNGEEAPEQEEQNRGSPGASEEPTGEDSLVPEPGRGPVGEPSFEINVPTGEGPQIDLPTGMFEDGGNRDAHPRLDRETPLSRVSPDQEVEEREDETFAPPLDEEDIDVEECVRLLRRFRAERERLRQHCRELQAKLAHYFNSKTADDGQQERGGTAIDRDYRKHMAILADLKWRQARITEAAQQQTEELKLRSQEKLDQVEKEWRDLMALKQDVLVTVLRGKLGKQAAQAKVEQIQASEHHHEDKLVKARLENIRLKNKIRKYQVSDCPKEEQEKRLQLLCSELMSESKALNEKIDMQNKELLKLSNKIIATTEVLTHVKEKFQWSLTENHAKRSRLAEVKSTVAEKRDALTRLKQACNSLRADNLRLKERRGLLGNTVLLRDYEDQVDACDHLEEQLRQLRLARAELVPKSGRRRKKRL